MICRYYGKDIDPKRMNQELLAVGGYANGNLLRFGDVSKIFPDVAVDWTKFVTNPSDVMIDAVLERKIPVIIQVDFKPATTALDQHWVVIIGKDEDGYVIADPIDGTIISLSRYAGKAYRMVVYLLSATPPANEVLFKAKCIAWYLYKRSGAGTNFGTVGYLVKGAVVNVYEEKHGWYRIDPVKQVWCSGSTRYMRKI